VKTTLQAIFRDSFSGFSLSRAIPDHHRKAARSIIECRTAALGGHIQRCPGGHVEEVRYHSCRHRSCPQCSQLARERWLERQKARLLACDHFHVIFTIAQELHQLWWLNSRLLIEILFQSARDTLFELLRDERHLGAVPGVMISLHTWGRTLSLHPHVHCLVSGGGLSPSGQWVCVSNGYLLPVRVVRIIFRGKILAALGKALEQGRLVLPQEMTEQKLKNLLNQLGRKKWNVCIRERYSHGAGVITYLARYVRGGAISNGRLSSADEREVSFRYQDHRDGKVKPMILSSEEFVQRVLWHVPQKGMQVIRHYGLYGRCGQALRDKCRAQLGQRPEEKPVALDLAGYWGKSGHPEKLCCPVCGQRMISAGRFPRGGSPPYEQDRQAA
jgi:Putative transposase/Transposase zinc-binding domain